MKQSSKLALWIGGIVLGAAAVGGTAYALSSKSSTSTTTTGATFVPGRNYLIMAPIPSGATTPAAVQAALAAQGFTAVTVVYFGPQGVLQSNVNIPFSVSSTMYVAQVTYSGTAPLAVPAGVSYVAL